MLAAGRALDQRHLVGRGPLVGTVRTGAVTGPLAVVEQVASVGVLIHPEQLILSVGQPDAQCHAAIGQGDVLLDPHLPGALGSTFVPIEHVEQGVGCQIHGPHSHVVHWRGERERRQFIICSCHSNIITPCLTIHVSTVHPLTCTNNGIVTFEDKLSATHNIGGVHPSAVAPAGIDAEGGVFANGVRVVVVVAFPSVVVVMEDKVAGEEQDLWPDLTALAHPLAVQTHRHVCPWR